jgi:uncharacterized protein (DUF885 family)
MKRIGVAAVISAGILATVSVGTSGKQQAGGGSTELLALVDDLVGQGGVGAAAGDLGVEAFAEQLKRTKAQLARCRGINRGGLSVDDALDVRFAESVLVGRELSQERMQYWRKDPRVYMAFRSLEGIIGSSGDAAAKRESVVRALNAIPRQLANGQKNLQTYVPRFQELGVFMAETAVDLFDTQVPTFAAQLAVGKDEVLQANTAARNALASYLAFLRNDLPKRRRGDFAIGKVTYDAMLKGQYLLPYDSEGLYKYAWEEFNRTIHEMEQVARTIDPAKTWRELIVEIKNDQPDPTKLFEVHQEMVNKARQHVLSKGLIPIPWKERVDVVPHAEYLRQSSFYGQFSGARSRGPEKDGTLLGQWQINPFDPKWDAKTKHDFMVEHDWGAIYVIAPHETYPGHHVQGLYQMHNPRKLRRSQGSTLFSEGWGLYTEQLMQETGFLPNERIHLRQLQSRLWRNARLIFVVGMHTGQMTYDEALSFMTGQVGFARYAAEAEVSRGISSPDQQMSYFMGMTEILRMREEYKRRMGEKFSLSDFHERLLKIGSMPSVLMREALIATTAATQ